MDKYKITKINSETEKEFNLGNGYSEQDVQAIIKGYTFNGLFYSRMGSKWFYIVEHE